MNPKLIQKFTEFLKEKGYSRQTIHDYSKALEQAPNTLALKTVPVILCWDSWSNCRGKTMKSHPVIKGLQQ